jgi:hypothetical protein
MNISDNTYDGIVTRFCNETLNNWYYLFKITKCCGYSCLVIVPKYSLLEDLEKILELQLGKNTFINTFYISKINSKIYFRSMYRMTNIRELLQYIPLSYSVDECNKCVYQLYYDSECICV